MLKSTKLTEPVLHIVEQSCEAAVSEELPDERVWWGKAGGSVSPRHTTAQAGAGFVREQAT